MKKFMSLAFFAGVMLSGVLAALPADDAAKPALGNEKGFTIGIVNFKDVVEHSKYGKLEQSNFEMLKKQMESVLEEKEKTLTELSNKLNDLDYIDSLSSDAEKELKHKFRMVNQDLGQIQGQYYQTLNQANMKILQKLNDLVSQAATTIAIKNRLDLILNEDGGFYYSPKLDISKEVIAVLDADYDKEMKNNAAGTNTSN